MRDLVCVTIPIYHYPLRNFEEISLCRCVEMLGNFPITVFAPEGLDLSEIAKQLPQLRFEYFDPSFFKSVDGYNRLMLDDSLYERFCAYTFILVHQLDAFIFKNELVKWCESGYDYVGSPWLYHEMPWTPLGYLNMAIKRRVYRWFDFREPPDGGIHRAQYMGSAGNGGFSLRRIDRMREVLHKFDPQAERYRARRHFSHSEDIFFCVEANRYRRHVRVPGFRRSLEFGWEAYPDLSMRLSNGTLPFGCHAWNRPNFRNEWKRLFLRFGINLDSCHDLTSN